MAHEAPLVVCDPRILGGKPCIRGTRLSVELVLELFAGGATEDEVIGAYPQLNREAIRAALSYAAQAMKKTWSGT